MNSEEYTEHSTGEQVEQPPEGSIHPDTLKFMGMAKDLLESPGVKQSVAGEQQKEADADSHQYSVDSSGIEQTQTEQSQKEIQASHSFKDQPDTLNFMSMARELLNSPAVKQATDAKGQDQ